MIWNDMLSGSVQSTAARRALTIMGEDLTSTAEAPFGMLTEACGVSSKQRHQQPFTQMAG